MVLLTHCSPKKEVSPYENIVDRQPFSALTDSIQKNPKNDELWFRRAVLLNKNNFSEPALSDFRKAWSLKRDERYAVGIGTILLDKKPDSAINFLQGSQRDIPESFMISFLLARAFDAKGNIDASLHTLNQLLQKNPDQIDVLKLKADLLDRSGKSDSVLFFLQKAYAVAPYDLDLNYLLAFKYAEAENTRVISLCDSLISMDSLNLHAEPYYYKGIYFSNIHDYPKALAMFDAAIQHDYQYLNAYIEKGKVQLQQQKTDNALKTFMLVNTISPKMPDPWYWIAQCQEKLGKKSEAKLNYQRALGLDPDFTEAAQALEKLSK
jgi:tetratricopeptide (TPR) repeat protein